MNLLVDIGNTRIKIALAEQDSIRLVHTCADESEALQYAQSLTFEKGIVCAVGKVHADQWEAIGCTMFTHQTRVPIRNEYATPTTLGLDRLAAAIGAHTLAPGHDVLAIDCGTCITYDYVTAAGVYMGGGIAPGMTMKLQALHNFTEKLPLVPLETNTPLIGKTTAESILSGVVNGTVAEISGIIKRYTDISNNLAPVLCGGDAMVIKEKLEYTVLTEPNVVMKGLQRVLLLNE